MGVIALSSCASSPPRSGANDTSRASTWWWRIDSPGIREGSEQVSAGLGSGSVLKDAVDDGRRSEDDRGLGSGTKGSGLKLRHRPAGAVLEGAAWRII